MKSLPEVRKAFGNTLHSAETIPYQFRGGWGRTAVGCMHDKKNVCRLHGPLAHMAAALDRFTKELSAWVDSIPADANLCIRFFMLRPAEPAAAHEDEPQLDGDSQIFLLGRPGYQPKYQMLIPCTLDDGRTHFRDHPELPFRVHLMAHAPRMAPAHGMLALWGRTSDEVCSDLLQRNNCRWEIVPARSHIACDVPTLTQEIIEGFEEPFERPVAVRARRDCRPAYALNLEDPLVEGS